MPELKIKLYFEVWKHPQTRYWEKMPTSGSEEYLQLRLGNSRNNLIISFKHNHKDKYINLITTKIRDVETATAKIKYAWKKGLLELRTGMIYSRQYVRPEQDFKDGFLFLQYLRISTKYLILTTQLNWYHSKVSLYSRMPGISGTMRNRQYNGDGVEYGFCLRYRTRTFLDFQLSFGGDPQSWNVDYLGIQMTAEF
jgi:hypothetical protein